MTDARKREPIQGTKQGTVQGEVQRPLTGAASGTAQGAAVQGAVLDAVSCFSFLRGVLSPNALCREAKRLGYEAIALADRDNLCALPEFLRCCKASGLRPIIAAEVTEADEMSVSAKITWSAEITSRQKCVLLYAHGDSGYANLCRVITQRHCRKKFDLAKAILSDPTGLFAATDQVDILMRLHGHLPAFFRMRRPSLPPKAVRERGLPCLVLPESAFISPNIPHFSTTTNALNAPTASNASKAPNSSDSFAISNVHDDYHLHMLLRAIALNTTISALPRIPHAELFTPDLILLPRQDIAQQFAAFPEYLRQTEEFIRTIYSRQDFGAWIFPRHLQSDSESLETLRTKTLAGARRRFGTLGALSDPVTHRLDYELKIIGDKGFASYFLIVDDIVRQSPRTCGRGSGAASLVAYCLGITNVDPLRHNLMFERFLNPGRTDPPDLDIDFAWDERDRVLDYVLAKYGLEHAAMVATHLTFQPRSAMREIARVYGLPETEISTVTKKIPWSFSEDGGVDTSVGVDAYTEDGGNKENEGNKGKDSEDRYSRVPSDPPWPEIVGLAKRLIGLPKGIATHCGGMVITPEPLCHTTPVQYSAKGFPIIQWEKDGAEQMGLIKIDLLGNRSLAVIRDAISSIRSRGEPFDESKWDPISDPKTQDLLARGRSMGIFYVESPAMRLLQQKTGRGDFDHLVIHSSIIRPAANTYLKEYIRRLRGGAYKCLHPVLQEILSETYGIMVYQEDVVRVAMVLAGFSYEEANRLRKTITKKDRKSTLEDFRQRFFSGASGNGADRATIQKVWDMILSFSGYSFCKPHSASYAQVSFQAAFLKAHYPAAFMAAVLSNYGGFYSTQAYISEARRLGITILTPDVDKSEQNFTACNRQPQTIQVGLGQIKGLSTRAQDRIFSARTRSGAFTSLEDFFTRARLEESEAEKLVLSGACDHLAPELNRPQIIWKMRCFYQNGHSNGHSKCTGNVSDSCFSSYSGIHRHSPVPQLKPYPARQLLHLEYQSLGFLTSHHPLTLVFPHPAPPDMVKAADLGKYINRIIRIRGWRVTSRTVPTIKGDYMQFVTFEDETALFETVLFPTVYRRFYHMPGSDRAAFHITGKVVEEFGAITLEVKKVE